MGVEDFYGRWLMAMFQKYPLLKRSINQLPKTHSLSIDMNGLIHAITPEVYAYGKIDESKKRARKEEIANLIKKIRWETSIEEYSGFLKKKVKRHEEMTDDEWFNIVEERFSNDDISDGLIAKIEEATKAKVERVLFLEFCDKLVTKIEELSSRFGTEYMLNLAVDGPAPWAKIQQQRYRRFKTGKLNGEMVGQLTEDFYYFNASASITPGTTFMRHLDEYLNEWIKNRKNGYLKYSPTIVRYSSFKVPGEGEHKIFADFRDKIIENDPEDEEGKINIIIGKDADLLIASCISPLSHIFVCRENYHDNISIDEMKNVIQREMNYSDDEQKICIQDFVLITFFVGNDFLPRIYQFKNVKASLEVFIKLYKLAKKRLTNENGEIIWENFYRYLSLINKKSAEFFYSILDEDWAYPPKVLLDNTSEEGINLDKFSEEWYRKALKPQTEKGTQIYEKMFILPENDPDDIRDMCNCYLTGLQWILRYYTSGEARRDYLYPYLYAPLVEDILKTIEVNLKNGNFINNNSVSIRTLYTLRGIRQLDLVAQIPQQLVVTIPPPANEDILDPKLYSYVAEGGPLSDMAPIDFKEELDTISAGKEHQGIIFVPVCDPERIIKTVDGRKLTREMKDMIASQNIVVDRVKPGFRPRVIRAEGNRGNARGMRSRGRGNVRGRGDGRGRGRGGSSQRQISPPDAQVFVVEGGNDEKYEYENEE